MSKVVPSILTACLYLGSVFLGCVPVSAQTFPGLLGPGQIPANWGASQGLAAPQNWLASGPATPSWLSFGQDFLNTTTGTRCTWDGSQCVPTASLDTVFHVPGVLATSPWSGGQALMPAKCPLTAPAGKLPFVTILDGVDIPSLATMAMCPEFPFNVQLATPFNTSSWGTLPTGMQGYAFIWANRCNVGGSLGTLCDTNNNANLPVYSFTGVTNGTTASGNPTLHFASTPAAIRVGTTVSDTTTPSAIPAGTTILSVTGTTAVMSGNAAGAGVGSGDTLKFGSRFSFTTVARADACTLGQTQALLGDASLAITTVTGAGGTVYVPGAAVVNDTCWFAYAATPLPAFVTAMVLDYEVFDYRPFAGALTNLQAFASYVHSKGEKAVLYTNHMSAFSGSGAGWTCSVFGVGSGLCTNAGATNAPALLTAFDLTSIVADDPTDSPALVQQYLQGQLNEYANGTPLNAAQLAKIFLVTQMGSYMQSSTAVASQFARDNALGGLDFWNNNGEFASTHSVGYQQARCLVYGQPAACGQSPVPSYVLNDVTTGTTVNAPAKLTSSGTAIVTAGGETAGVIGIVIGGAGTSGSAQIVTAGVASCAFDGTATAGDAVQVSASGAQCHDTGSAGPATSNQVLGYVMLGGSGAGTYTVFVGTRYTDPGLIFTSGSGISRSILFYPGGSNQLGASTDKMRFTSLTLDPNIGAVDNGLFIGTAIPTFATGHYAAGGSATLGAVWGGIGSTNDSSWLAGDGTTVVAKIPHSASYLDVLSLALGGCAIGGNVFCATGTSAFNGVVTFANGNLALTDATTSAHKLIIESNSSTAMTGDPILVFDVVNAGRTVKLGSNLTVVTDPGAVTGVIKSNGSGTFAQGACANLSDGATGCSRATGTSGATIPLLNGANTWSGNQTFTGVYAAFGNGGVGGCSVSANGDGCEGSSTIDGFSFQGKGSTGDVTMYNAANAKVLFVPTGAGAVTLGPGVAFASLPSCAAGLQGSRAYITDSAAAPVWRANTVGGGSIKIPVFCDGTNWVNG